jgi:hypothetical protein
MFSTSCELKSLICPPPAALAALAATSVCGLKLLVYEALSYVKLCPPPAAPSALAAPSSAPRLCPHRRIRPQRLSVDETHV